MRFVRSYIIFASVFLLILLSGCGGTSSQPSQTHMSITPTSTTGPTPTPSPTPLPTLPNDHDPFQVTFLESSYFVPCPNSIKVADVCWNVSGTGTSIPYGPITFSSFDTNFYAPGKPSIVGKWDFCEPTTRQGSIVLGKDTLKFSARGSFCPDEVQFAYTVTAGTGKFQHAHGKGSITIPPAYTTGTAELEYWTGTLI